MASLGYTGLTQKRVSRCQKGGAGVGGMSLGGGREEGEERCQSHTNIK